MKKGDTKLAIILIFLLLIIAAVPILLTPSLTGFSYFNLEPDQQPPVTPQSSSISKITAFVTGIPIKNEAIIIASAIVFVILIGSVYWLHKRRQPIETVEPEEIITKVSEPLLPEKKKAHIGMSKAMLNSFIKRAALHGQSKEEVLDILTEEGWSKDEIENIVDEIFKQNRKEVKNIKKSNNLFVTEYDQQLDKIQDELNKLNKEKII